MANARKDFAAALIHDYTNKLEYARQIDEFTMESFDGENTVEIDTLDNKGSAVGVEIFVNGTSMLEARYNDSDFTTKVAETIVKSLNI